MKNLKSLVPFAILGRSRYEALKRQSRAPHLAPGFSLLVQQNVQLLLDVGANTGQYASNARKYGYEGLIVSFEPLSEAHAILSRHAASDPQWIVHRRTALGAKPGVVEINVSANSYSSSILPMLDTHAKAAPESIYQGVEKVDIDTLDAVFGSYRRSGEKTYLKIDTQGFESEVLAGFDRHLQDVFAIELEMSTVPLYEGQKLYDYFFDELRSRGFTLWSIMPGFCDPATGQMLQFDAVFVRLD